MSCMLLDTLSESDTDESWFTGKHMISKHLKQGFEFLHLLHALLCGPPGAMTRQPVREYGLTCS